MCMKGWQVLCHRGADLHMGNGRPLGSGLIPTYHGVQ